MKLETLYRGKKKKRGHFCWCCGLILPNEKFSGKGHKNYICKGCSKLGKEELNYRQVRRNIDKMVTFDGIIPKRNRVLIEKYVKHADPRVRQYVENIIDHDKKTRQTWRDEQLVWEAEESLEDGIIELYEDGFYVGFLSEEFIPEIM